MRNPYIFTLTCKRCGQRTQCRYSTQTCEACDKALEAVWHRGKVGQTGVWSRILNRSGECQQVAVQVTSEQGGWLTVAEVDTGKHHRIRPHNFTRQ